MIHIESTNDQELVERQFAEAGIKIGASRAAVAEPEPEKVAEEDPSGKPGAEGEDPEVPGDKTASESETGKTKTQEPPSQGDEHKAKGETPPARSADKKIGKLTLQLESAREELDATRGDKTKLATRVEELEAQIAELKPKESEKPALVRPKRPEMPELAEFEYDAVKFQAAMKQHRKDLEAYDEKLDDYNNQKTALAAQETVDAYQKAREKAEQEAAGERAAKAFAEKYASQAAEIDGWSDFWEEQPDNNPEFDYGPAVDAAIKRSDHPASIIWHLAHNVSELKRINALEDPVSQIAAIGRLDTKIEKQEKQTKADKEPQSEKQPEKKMNLQPEKKTPVQSQQRTRTPDAPITPVGGSATTHPTNDNAAYETFVKNGDTKGFVAEFTRRQAERMRAKYGR